MNSSFAGIVPGEKDDLEPLHSDSFPSSLDYFNMFVPHHFFLKSAFNIADSNTSSVM